ncbi:hypothetical protein [Shimia isoporae]|uniref:hypothetical protein n=1 Tax=Shimia isoporae TaxID=647720 RepID=UPI00104ED56F|nr:hypothetical protein [Shimia isoporae]
MTRLHGEDDRPTTVVWGFADAAKDAGAAQVLHRSRNRYRTVNNSAMFSIVWLMCKFFVNKINDLQKCLFFVQINEMGRKQRKIAVPAKLSPNLSTGTVDLFSLETKSRRLQGHPKNHISGL